MNTFKKILFNVEQINELKKDLDRAHKNNAELNLKFNQTINEMDTKNNELFKKQAGRVHILFKL